MTIDHARLRVLALESQGTFGDPIRARFDLAMEGPAIVALLDEVAALRAERGALRKSEEEAAAHAAECVRLQWAAEAERDTLAALLREALPYLRGTGWGMPGINLPDRIDAALGRAKP